MSQKTALASTNTTRGEPKPIAVACCPAKLAEAESSSGPGGAHGERTGQASTGRGELREAGRTAARDRLDQIHSEREAGGHRKPGADGGAELHRLAAERAFIASFRQLDRDHGESARTSPVVPSTRTRAPSAVRAGARLQA
jgi:hypothetical protein